MSKAGLAKLKARVEVLQSLLPAGVGYKIVAISYAGRHKGWGRGRAADAYAVMFKTTRNYGAHPYLHGKLLTRSIALASGSLEETYATLGDYRKIRRAIGRQVRDTLTMLRTAQKEVEKEFANLWMERDTGRIALTQLRRKL